MDNSKIQIFIEEDVTSLTVDPTPIVIEAQLAIPIIGAGNYLLADLDTYKTDGFLRFMQSKELQFQESGTTVIHGESNGVFIDLESVNLFIRNGTSDRFAFDRSSGDFTAVGDIAAYSDKRLKADIQPISDALKKVKQLNGVTFVKISDPDRRNTGLIAQEVLKVVPEAVKEDDAGFLSVSYGNLVGLLIEAIKELIGVVENGNSCRCSDKTSGCANSKSSEPK